MAEIYTLDAQSRNIVGKKVSQLRVQGLVPAVIYGAHVDPVTLQIPYRPLEIALGHAGGTHLINVNFDGKTQSVITREVQRDVLRGTIMHVDFLAVDASTRITAEIPVHIVGESSAVSQRLGMLLQGTATLSIEAVPAELIDAIEVDISGLKAVGDAIHVRDLKVSDLLEILNDPDELIVRINPLRAVEETEEAAEETPTSEPEIIARGKAEEEEED